MAENVEQATRPQLAELVQLLVERVQTKARTVEPGSIEWAPPRPPVLRACCVAGAPPDGRTGALVKRDDDPLAWYATATG